jgi:hypothetical protein
MKKTILLISLVAASSLSAQSFVAGWDFDNVNAAAPSATANWGLQSGSAIVSWTHTGANPPIVFTSEFDVTSGAESETVNTSFTFLTGGVDPGTGYTAFTGDDYGATAKQGWASNVDGETFSVSFSGTGWTGLQLRYAYSATSDMADFALTTVDLSAFDGVASAVYDFNPTAGGLYDNFAITGVVPEPSQFGAIAGLMVLGLAVIRRRRK